MMLPWHRWHSVHNRPNWCSSSLDWLRHCKYNSASLGLQFSQRLINPGLRGVLQPMHFGVALANLMMPPEAADGVEIMMDFVCWPAHRSNLLSAVSTNVYPNSQTKVPFDHVTTRWKSHHEEVLLPCPSIWVQIASWEADKVGGLDNVESQ